MALALERGALARHQFVQSHERGGRGLGRVHGEQADEGMRSSIAGCAAAIRQARGGAGSVVASARAHPRALRPPPVVRSAAAPGGRRGRGRRRRRRRATAGGDRVGRVARAARAVRRRQPRVLRRNPCGHDGRTAPPRPGHERDRPRRRRGHARRRALPRQHAVDRLSSRRRRRAARGRDARGAPAHARLQPHPPRRRRRPFRTGRCRGTLPATRALARRSPRCASRRADGRDHAPRPVARERAPALRGLAAQPLLRLRCRAPARRGAGLPVDPRAHARQLRLPAQRHARRVQSPRLRRGRPGRERPVRAGPRHRRRGRRKSRVTSRQRRPAGSRRGGGNAGHARQRPALPRHAADAVAIARNAIRSARSPASAMPA